MACRELGSCNLEPALDGGSSWAHLALAEAGSTPSSTSIALRVSERECTSARDPSAYLHQPYVESTDDAVTVYWTTDTPTGGQDCPGNPAVQRSVELAEPLGARAIFDGSVWPPRPLRP
jgi:hypothetical protein